MDENVKPYAVVRIGGCYKALSKHPTLLDASKAVMQVRNTFCATIIRDGTTGKRLTQGAAEAIAKADAA